ncbi:MAG: L-aspartate oxidase [Weeksellaceae bacterium]|nr:L-aspartate oxidase [Weeksellaceae bacterium]
MFADVLVIGSGISGLSYALKVSQQSPDAKIVIVTKSDEDESNTKYAQGGLAVVTDFDNDSFNKHVEDTLRAGDGLCDREVVEMVVREGPVRFKEIVDWGARFDVNDMGTYDLGMEGGHTQHRIVHHKDITGYEIERALLAAVNNSPNITLLSHHYVVDLITEHHLGDEVFDESNITCYGAYVLDIFSKSIKKYTAKITLMATGGVGHVYKNTTNPIIATGDGIGLASRAKAKVSDMAFIQFHPTALYSPLDGNLFLISEAVRGFGAKLRTMDGQPFMHLYDEREELASRDIVARAIDDTMKRTGSEYVGLDCRHLNQEEFMKHFPNIYERCRVEGYNLFQELIPVVPAQHYLCGGIEVDMDGQSSIHNMFAVGECTRTGLHGANRLASNSLLEAMVYAHNAAMKTVQYLKQNNFNMQQLNSIPEWDDSQAQVMDEMVVLSFLRKELQALMSDLVGIVRSNERLKLALIREKDIFTSVKEIYNFSVVSPQLSELRNLSSVAHLIITQSIAQTENRGAFFNKDLVPKN